MSTVVLSGAADALGQRVARAVRAAASVEQLIVVDHHDLHGPDLKARLEGATVAVHLEGGMEETHALLDAAAAVGVAHVVVLSSATVYGAWANNPVPLTEDAALRPNAERDFAVRAAERERLASDWKHEHPGATVAVLRPAVPVAEDASGWLARGLREMSAIRAAGPDDPPGQYVHLDDLTAAIVLAVTARLDGAFNVCPDGWINGEQPIARRFAWLRWKLSPASAPPGLVPYTMHPWVVANDRIKAAGWSPSFTNEEAYVEGHRALPWATVSPQRRQEIALAATGAGLIALIVGIVVLIRRSSASSRPA